MRGPSSLEALLGAEVCGLQVEFFALWAKHLGWLRASRTIHFAEVETNALGVRQSGRKKKRASRR